MAQDIVDTAVAAGSFKTLAAALTAGGLVAALKGAGPFTVLAPTDAAFAKLPAGTVETLVKPENKAKLVEILSYHVIAGKFDSGAVSKLTSAPTLGGKALSIAVVDGKVKLGGNATVTTADVAASNGIIHIIDEVLIPA